MITLKNLNKSYDKGTVQALKDFSLTVEEGEILALMGPSGCGKSTLLNLIGSLDFPDSGSIAILGEELRSYRSLQTYRSRVVGFVFQSHHLIPSLTLKENVELPMFSINVSSKERSERAVELLHKTGLEHRIDFYPNNVSGGERQRAAIARALANNPRIILADEPTGSIDSRTGEMIVSLLKDQCVTKRTTLIIATHNPGVASVARRVINILDGQIT